MNPAGVSRHSSDGVGLSKESLRALEVLQAHAEFISQKIVELAKSVVSMAVEQPDKGHVLQLPCERPKTALLDSRSKFAADVVPPSKATV